MKTAELAAARTCYGHLAGRAGVELLDAMVAHGLLLEQSSSRPDLAGPPRFDVTDAGARTLGSFGLDIGELRGSRRRFAGTCVDWTERRWHLNGALAVAITTRLFELSWLERGPGRSVLVTAAGAGGLAQTFGLRTVLALRPADGVSRRGVSRRGVSRRGVSQRGVSRLGRWLLCAAEQVV